MTEMSGAFDKSDCYRKTILLRISEENGKKSLYDLVQILFTLS